MSEGWLPNGEPDPNYQGQTWASPEEKTKVLLKYESEFLGKDAFGNILNSRKERKKVTNYTKPKNRKKKK